MKMATAIPVFLLLAAALVDGFAPSIHVNVNVNVGSSVLSQSLPPPRSDSCTVLRSTSRGDEDTRQEVSTESELESASLEDDDMKMSEEDRKKFDQIANDFLKNLNIDNNDDEDNNIDGEEFPDFPSAMPPVPPKNTNPFASSLDKARARGEGKGEVVYSDMELMSVLNLHKELSKSKDDDGGDNDGDDNDGSGTTPLGGIHDLITKNLGMPNVEPAPVAGATSKIPPPVATTMNVEIHDEELKRKMKQIRAIASDVDGTILTTKQTVHPRTRLAIRKAIQLASSSASSSSSNGSSSGIDFFFPATGKSRRGALDSLGIEIGNLIDQKCPGVYLQGLFCVDARGEVVFEQKLHRDAIAAAEALVTEFEISIVAYDGDDLYTTEQTDIVIHLHEHYGEPLPLLLPSESDTDDTEEVSSSSSSAKTATTLRAPRSLSSHEPSMHKLLLMDDDVDKLTNEIRPKLEELAKRHGACVTQALPTMLELLPEGCSKKLGVMKLCDVLGIEPGSELLALGDAENDAGMLELAAVGVAVGNATPPAKDASDYIVDLTNDEGGAGMAMELFALNR